MHNESFLSKPRTIISAERADWSFRPKEFPQASTLSFFEVTTGEAGIIFAGPYMVPLGGKLEIKHIECED